MNNTILGLLAETHIHAGIGRTMGAIDLPVSREKPLDYPFIPGSSFKGALREAAESKWGLESDEVNRWFGRQDNAGKLLVGDAKLLALPVRCLNSAAYRWLTCPLILERYQRDRRRLGQSAGFDIPEVSLGRLLGADETVKVFLEERLFTGAGPVTDTVVAAVEECIPLKTARKRCRRMLAVVNDEDFAWFARYALPVSARNILADETKTSRNLWYEESLPPDTLLWSCIIERGQSKDDPVQGLFGDGTGYLQAGGNETVGMGWFALHRLGTKEGICRP